MEEPSGKYCRLNHDLQRYGDILTWRLEFNDFTGSVHCMLQPTGKVQASVPNSPQYPPHHKRLASSFASCVLCRVKAAMMRCKLLFKVPEEDRYRLVLRVRIEYSQNNFDQRESHKIAASLFIFSVIENLKPGQTKSVRSSSNVDTERVVLGQLLSQD